MNKLRQSQKRKEKELDSPDRHLNVLELNVILKIITILNLCINQIQIIILVIIK